LGHPPLRLRLRASTQPTNQGIFNFDEGIVKETGFLGFFLEQFSLKIRQVIGIDTLRSQISH